MNSHPKIKKKRISRHAKTKNLRTRNKSSFLLLKTFELLKNLASNFEKKKGPVDSCGYSIITPPNESRRR